MISYINYDGNQIKYTKFICDGLLFNAKDIYSALGLEFTGTTLKCLDFPEVTRLSYSSNNKEFIEFLFDNFNTEQLGPAEVHMYTDENWSNIE